MVFMPGESVGGKNGRYMVETLPRSDQLVVIEGCIIHVSCIKNSQFSCK